MSANGNCECGAVGYRIAGSAPLHVYACHCLNCQTRSGSAFAEHAMIPLSAFTCQGSTESHSRETDGIHFEEVFCDRCRTRLFNRNSALPDMIFLRAGTLSDSHAIEPMAHIWTKRRQRWISIPEDIPAFAESPTPEEFAAAIARAESRGEPR